MVVLLMYEIIFTNKEIINIKTKQQTENIQNIRNPSKELQVSEIYNL